ncbi:hypothetical protein CYA_2207 [Synechococcus sp. JA-3-3Ab]|nr:hypothetical protein CYA_2207 [Synechococcus sp. JA-3-3Ab]
MTLQDTLSGLCADKDLSKPIKLITFANSCTESFTNGSLAEVPS